MICHRRGWGLKRFYIFSLAKQCRDSVVAGWWGGGKKARKGERGGGPHPQREAGVSRCIISFSAILEHSTERLGGLSYVLSRYCRAKGGRVKVPANRGGRVELPNQPGGRVKVLFYPLNTGFYTTLLLLLLPPPRSSLLPPPQPRLTEGQWMKATASCLPVIWSPVLSSIYAPG